MIGRQRLPGSGIDLPVSLIERLVLVLALVLPRELPAPPDVHEAVIPLGAFGSGADDFHVLFKTVVGARRISLGWGGLAEQPTEIDEMLLAGRALGKLNRRPFGHKLIGSKRR